ncbi:hypothetical protein AB6A40_007863 [Gnathostoma spinigerum]|uniref:Secreted protein n=1 Tax=Gnathostoma spinigerum TaxID=75299 RepID=A0ABD6EV68_9BILA
MCLKGFVHILLLCILARTTVVGRLYRETAEQGNAIRFFARCPVDTLVVFFTYGIGSGWTCICLRRGVPVALSRDCR